MSQRVGVLMGGMSSERDVSMKSGAAVAAALRSRGHDVVEIDVDPELPAKLRAERIDVAWIALHGAFGEDGCVQGLLEIMRIPYTGSGVLASAAAMDKIMTKRLLLGSEVMLPDDVAWRAGEPMPEVSLPVVVKTPEGGSTIGVYMCDTAGELESALLDCQQWSQTVLVEQKIVGEEITVAVLDGVALPVVSIRPRTGFFDFEAKYTKGQTDYLVPSPLPAEVTEHAQRQAVAAYACLELEGIARADFIVDAEGIPWFLEINTIPGMTATSLSPMAAGAMGVSFEELVERLLQGARLRRTVSLQEHA
ncbi:MAG: D-alanine-D-alanine ligase [Myxococcota bacterium]|jgi:D-alanine-D-alanine ligase